ncbi:hypothetical protein C8A01DRAFT_34058 [Parachaetomium inaequale]|uniref:Protein kinase domain-containing protein n=1 Tax=Parachaetomium inaequale TaxID=2588326 RepID=A0AAN6STG3_9PEZI|nr:hypothetical protein C8A01DRAFT_34058 [Parachaetomium inaequale]
MEILQFSEAFRVVGEKLEFACVKGIVRYNPSVYFGKWQDRRHPPLSLSELYDVKRVETDDKGPETPSLFDYASTPDLERQVHNDITPANIMRDEEDGAWVIIDFDSCRHVGEVLRDNTWAKRTHGWHDPGVAVSSEKNDLDAFSELRAWLFGSSADEFLFW